ncbi:MAG: nitroreductase family protein [Prevotella sp.]|nr:nitroreductase family protein [Prevotella sp.]
MKKQIITLALLLLTGAGAAQAQDCCQGSEKKECCQKAAIENIMTRTSIRKFKQQAVEAEKVEAMLRAAMAAPTAVNKQPWHFVVVTDKQVLSELAGQGGRGNMLRNAPLAIVVCGDMSKAMQGKGQEYWIQDTSAATENLLLAAHALGLGAVWTGAYPMDDRYTHIQKVLGMPETVVPLNICIIGYPDEQPTPKDKWKPENVSYNKFGAK